MSCRLRSRRWGCSRTGGRCSSSVLSLQGNVIVILSPLVHRLCRNELRHVTGVRLRVLELGATEDGAGEEFSPSNALLVRAGVVTFQEARRPLEEKGSIVASVHVSSAGE